MGFAGKFKFSWALEFCRMGGTDSIPGKRGDGELMMDQRMGMRER